MEAAAELLQEFANEPTAPAVEMPIPSLKIFRGMAG
jgi:hypothetical protein